MKKSQRKRVHLTPHTHSWSLLFGCLATALLSSTVGCKSRFFDFSEEPALDTKQPSQSDQNRSGQIAIDQQAHPNTVTTPQSSDNVATVPYTPLQGTPKKIILGSTQRFEVNGQQVDVTFEKIIEDSRCPRDVVCIWEGQAKLEFAVSVPALGLSRKVVPILRAGHPHLGQILVGTIGLDLVGLSPDSVAGGQKAIAPEATVVVGRAP